MITIENLSKEYKIGRISSKKNNIVYALQNINLNIAKGETIGIVGESGSGKTTLARVLTGLVSGSSGYFQYDNFRSDLMNKSEWKLYRKKIQMVFQDPYSSLNPSHNIAKIISEPAVIFDLYKSKNEVSQKVSELLSQVGLSSEAMNKYPHQFSGGQRQRIGIARSLMLQPETLILDEPVSSLDVSIQAQILNLLLDLKKKFNLTYIFIAHDLNVVRYLSDKIAVILGGRIVEYRNSENLFSKPLHPYTVQLLSSIPGNDSKMKYKRKHIITAQGANEEFEKNTSSGCTFFPYCWKRTQECSDNLDITYLKKGEYFRCLHPEK